MNESAHVEHSFIASDANNTFHKPDCEWASVIPLINALKFWSDREARREGFRPCRTCKPGLDAFL